MSTLKLVQMQRFEGDSAPSLTFAFNYQLVTDNGDGSFTLPIPSNFRPKLTEQSIIVSFVLTTKGQLQPDYELIAASGYITAVKFTPDVANNDPFWLKIETFDYGGGFP